jgi:hypothetical protein
MASTHICLLFNNSYEGKKCAVVPIFLTEHHAMEAYWGSVGINPLVI